jgi:hypothetical protein
MAECNNNSLKRKMFFLSRRCSTLVIVAASLFVCMSWTPLSSLEQIYGLEQTTADVHKKILVGQERWSAQEGHLRQINRLQKQRLQKYKSLYNYTLPGHKFSKSAEECGARPDFEDFFKLSKKERSRSQEDKIIYDMFFKDRLTGTGTYIELGAYDGLEESNTRFFDLCLGWKGLLIEGQPATFKKTVQNRPRAHKMSFAPSCSEEYEAENGTLKFYKHPLTNSGLEGKAKAYEGRAAVDVPCGPLGPVLEDVFRGKSISFFSLDVEGAEPMVLETIDFEKVHIDVLMIEVENIFCKKNTACESRDATREIMERAGYTRYENIVKASDVYVHPETTFAKTGKSKPRAKIAPPPAQKDVVTPGAPPRKQIPSVESKEKRFAKYNNK